MNKSLQATRYVKNVLKSAGYIAASTAKGINPELTSFISDSIQVTKDIAHKIKDSKNNKTDFIHKYITSEQIEQGKDIARNILSDIKTGKFYNPERKEQNEKNMMKDFLGIDLNFDFDDSKDDSDDDQPLTISDKINISQTSILSESVRKNSKMSMANNERLSNGIMGSLAVIDASILNLHQSIIDPLNTYIKNSTSFYTTATEELAKHTSYLENINTLFNSRFNKAEAPIKEKNAWESIIGGYGIPNFKNWKDAIFKKFSSSSGIGPLAGLLTALDPKMSKMILGSMAESPIADTITNLLTNKLRSGPIGQALDRTIETIRSGFVKIGTNIHDYKRKHDNIFGKLAGLIDIVPDNLKANLDFSAYNKEIQDWTGKDSKALQVVIPTQLSAILAAITNTKAKIFDYDLGRFINPDKAIRDFEKGRVANISSSISGARQLLLKEFIDQDKKNLLSDERYKDTPSYNYNSRAVINLGKDFDKLISLLISKGIDISNFTKPGSIINFCKANGWIDGEDGILSSKNIEEIDNIIFKNTITTGSFIEAAYNGSFANKSFIEKAFKDSSLNAVKNGSNITNVHKLNDSLSLNIDNKGHNIFFYLQDYYSQFRHIISNINNSGVRKIDDKKNNSNGLSYEVPIDKDYINNYYNRFGSPKIKDESNISKEDRTTEENSRDLLEFDYYSGENRFRKMTDDEIATSRDTRERESRQDKRSIIAKGIDGINKTLDEAFFGEHNFINSIRASVREHGGIFGFIKDLPNIIEEGITKTYEKIRNWIKEKWNKFKESDFGKDFFGALKNYIFGGIKDSVDYGMDKMSGAFKKNADPKGSYEGGQVKESGMVSVSEGEIIIPAKYNPYYTGHMGDDARKSIEHTNYRNWIKNGGDEDDFFGYYRHGGLVKKKKAEEKYPIIDLSSRQKNSIKELNNDGYSSKEISNILKINIDQVDQVLHGSLLAERDINYIKTKISENYHSLIGSDINKKVSEEISKVIYKLEEAIVWVTGGPTENFKDNLKEVWRAANVSLPKTAASGTLGAIIGGAMTGSGIGLLGGFAVGAGITILKNSSSLSEKLFGKYDENTKEWVGGKLPSGWTKFIKEKLPKSMKAGTLGAILGTIGIAPGGILGGFVLGSGLELLSTTSTFKDIMFGKPNIYGNRHGGIVGSLKFNVVDPLADFVKDGIKKADDYIKDNLLKPLIGIFDPLRDWVTGFTKNRIIDGLFRKIYDKFKLGIDRTFGELFDATLKPISTTIGKIGKKTLSGIGNIVSSSIKKVGKSIELHNIKAGYSSKNAKERMKYEDTKYGFKGLRKFKNTAYTKWAANASDDDIIKAQYFMNGKDIIERGIDSRKQDLADVITASMINGGIGNPKIVKELKSLFNTDRVKKDNDFSEIIEAINNLDPSLMGSATKKQLIKRIKKDKRSIFEDRNLLKDYDKQRSDFFSRIGFNPGKEKELKKFISKGKYQSKLDADAILKNRAVEANNDIEEGKSIDAAKELIDKQIKENPLDAKRNNILESIDIKLSAISKLIGVSSDVIKSTVSKVTSEVPQKSKEVYNTVLETIDNKIPFVASKKEKQKNQSESKNDHPKEGQHRTVTTSEGDTLDQVYDKGNGWINNIRDAETNNVLERKEEDRNIRNRFFNLFLSGSIIERFRNLFNNKKDKKDNDSGDKKPSLFERIKETVLGPRNIIGGIGLGGLAKVALSGLGGLVTALLGSELAEDTAGTKYDPGMRSEIDPNDRKEEVDNLYGISGLFKKNILAANMLENAIRGRDMTTFEQDEFISDYATENMAQNMAKNLLLSTTNDKYAKNASKIIDKTIGKIPLIGKPISRILKVPVNIKDNIVNAKEKSVKTISDITDKINSTKNKFIQSEFNKKLKNNISKLATKSRAEKKKIVTTAEKVNEKMVNVKNGAKEKFPKIFGVFSDIKSGGDRLTGNVTKAIDTVKKSIHTVFDIIVSKMGIKMPNASTINKLFSEVSEKIVKKGGSKLVKNLIKINPILNLIFIANAIIEGAQKSKTKIILGILSEPTLGERVIAAIINGVNEAIPGIGGLIPSEYLVNIFFTLLQLLGHEDSDLAKKRAEAKAEVERYNIEYNKSYNIEEYIHNVLGEYTIQEKIGNTVSSVSRKAYDALSNFFGDDKKEEDLISDSLLESNYSNLNNKSFNNQPMTINTYNGTPSMGYSNVINVDFGNNKSFSEINPPIIKPYLSFPMIGSSNNIQPFNNTPNYMNANYVGAGSGIHTTQIGNNSKFGNSTIEQNGCGPAAASTILKSYGKDIGIDKAAKYATSNGYVAGLSSVSGTKASYFDDIFEKNGISTEYSNDTNKIENAVNAGNPTVLLGQDNKNTSKINSPFGPNPHYIVARGTDSKGNIIVDDPELKETALYNKNILKNAKLGVITNNNKLNKNNKSQNINRGGDSGILSSINGLFSSIGSRLSGNAEKIFNMIFNINKDTESSNLSINGENNSSYSYGFTDYGESPFPIAKDLPSLQDPNINLYNNTDNNGISLCDEGNPVDPERNVLSNCVGWACGRFNHIYNILTGYNGIKFPNFNCNAEDFIEVAKAYGLEVGSDPRPGAIMVWRTGNIKTPNDGRGHVAIVEKVESSDKVLTSESEYDGSKFKNIVREKGKDGNWGKPSSSKFRGFIYNPAVINTLKMNPSDSKKYIFKWLTNNGFSKTATSGIMGCWEAESGNMADRVEGDYLGVYPGSDKVLSSNESLNDYTLNTLFHQYDLDGIEINKDAYKGPDGNYYAGIGLAQWTGPRAYNLIEHSKRIGKSFRSTEAQLDFFKHVDLPERNNNLINTLNTSNSPEDAATEFLDGFEMSSGWHNDNSTGIKQNDVRRGNARNIYEAFNDIGSGSNIHNVYDFTNPNYVKNIKKSFNDIGSGSNSIHNVYDFTNPNYVKNIKKSFNDIGSGSNIHKTTKNNSNHIEHNNLSNKKLDDILLFLKQITNNTGYNASIPVLVDIMKQFTDIMSKMTTNKKISARQKDFTQSINNDIELMRTKLESIAKSI